MIWSWDTGQWLSCFDSCQLTILWMSYIKDVELPRHAWEAPPFLLIVFPTPPVQSVDEYVRTYARSITWQPNEKRLTIFLEYGALSHARKTRVEAPLRTSNLKRRAKAIDLMQQKPYAMISIFSTKKNLLGISNGEALINTLWLFNSLHFGVRGCGEHRQMC